MSKPVTAAHHAAPSNITLRAERPRDAACIDRLVAAVFGPGANTRAAAALREGVANEPALSFVATTDSTIIGTCRLTPVLWGRARVMMLGPLGVNRAYMGTGIGKGLMAATVAAADEAGEDVVILVGDLRYYAPFGFQRIAPDRIEMPRPTDPMRVLAREATLGIAAAHNGPVTRSL